MVDAGSADIPHGTMRCICDALVLDDEQLWAAYQGDYTAEMYEAYLRTVPKDRLMPPALRR